MALIPKISVSQTDDCDNIIICDITGLYSLTNVGGYNNTPGDPNIMPTDVSQIDLEITPSGGTAVSATLNVDTAALGTCTCVTIVPDDYGYTSWDDGAYSYIYTVTDSNSNTYTTTGGFVLFCSLEVDVDSKILGLCDGSTGCDPCTEDAMLDRLVRIKVVLDGAQYAAANGAVDCADDLLERAQAMSDNLCNDC